MHETTAKRPSGVPDTRRRPRLGRRLLAAFIGAALLPGVLVVLATQGIGSRSDYWAATAVALLLLGAWPLAARPRGAGVERTAALAFGILTVLLVGFFAGSIVTTVAVQAWQPEIRVDLPSAGA